MKYDLKHFHLYRMQRYQFSRSKDRELVRFYEKIRLQYADIECDSQGKPHHDASELAGIPEEKIYGKITKEDFLEILDSYARQQSSNNLQDKPVACDKVDGSNYAKLLFSRPGFHHMGSTAYLAEDLKLENIQTNSLLGGDNSYALGEKDGIEALRKLYDMGDIRRSVEKITKHLDNNELDEAEREIDKITRTHPKCGEILVVRGRYHFKKRHYPAAIRDMGESLNYDLADIPSVRRLLSDCFFEYGSTLFNRRDYRNAFDAFTEALQHNDRNQSARMYLEMCQSHLHQHHRSFTPRPAYRK